MYSASVCSGCIYSGHVVQIRLGCLYERIRRMGYRYITDSGQCFHNTYSLSFVHCMSVHMTSGRFEWKKVRLDYSNYIKSYRKCVTLCHASLPVVNETFLLAIDTVLLYTLC